MFATHGCVGTVMPGLWNAACLDVAAIRLSSDPQGPKPDGTPGRSRQPDLRARLGGSTILLVEDEAMVAMDIELALGDAGAHVLGPAASLSQALEIAQGTTRIDGAIVDIDLGGEDALPLADLLTARSVPFLFHTGVGRKDAVAARYPQAGLCLKPVPVEDLLDDLAALMG